MKAFLVILTLAFPAAAFEGRITAKCTQGGDTVMLLYTVGTSALRLEVTGSDRPNPVDVLDLQTGTLTLFFPHNRSFVRLKSDSGGAHASARVPADVSSASVGHESRPTAPETGALPAPAGVGPQPQAPAAAAMSAMPAMPMPMRNERMELKATGQKTNLLGMACERFEIKHRGEVIEIWATETLLPFQGYVRNQPRPFGPRLLEEQWAELLTARKLFPLLASLRFENGAERFRFEVLSITPQKLKPEDAQLLLPPQGYFEIQPLAF